MPKSDSYTKENNQLALEIIKIAFAAEKRALDEDVAADMIAKARQPCRLEKVSGRDETILMDVCHNIDGFKAVLSEIRSTYPAAENIKIVIGVSKSKKMDNLVHYLDEHDLVSEIYLVSRPHMRLFKIEEVHRAVQQIGCKKLVDLFGINVEAQSTEGNTSVEENSSADGSIKSKWTSNIAKTLDYLLKEKNDLSEVTDNGDNKNIMLICGSFFIMSDVRDYFGYTVEADDV